MTYDHPLAARRVAANAVCTALFAFPIACFSLTVLTDLAYWRTLNLLWLHFSEWLLLAGLVFGVIAMIAHLVELLVWRLRPSWLSLFGGLMVLLLATLNSFIHTADGWPAVMPWGLTVSIVTVVAMIVTAWWGRGRAYRV
jgi:uncharacterized membrane protein